MFKKIRLISLNKKYLLFIISIIFLSSLLFICYIFVYKPQELRIGYPELTGKSPSIINDQKVSVSPTPIIVYETIIQECNSPSPIIPKDDTEIYKVEIENKNKEINQLKNITVQLENRAQQAESWWRYWQLQANRCH